MKSVLISIQPKWCELIASEKKTVEVRKTRPKIQTPFKCYIYESRNGGHRCKHCKEKDDCYYYAPKNIGCYNGRGRVIGEFVCDEVDTYSYDYCDGVDIDDDSLLYTMLERDEINYYAKGKTSYGWHISDLKIYDKPKELCEFLCKCNKKYCTGCEDFCDEGETSFRMCGGLKVVTRPPQSWSYVEELEEEK